MGWCHSDLRVHPEDSRPGTTCLGENRGLHRLHRRNTLFRRCLYDRDPSRIIVADSRRDSELVETDSFQIILDTYRDQQTGFVFGTNPVGIEYDGQVTREGEGGAFSAGGFNKNWDGVLGRQGLDQRYRLERRIRDSLYDPSVSPGRESQKWGSTCSATSAAATSRALVADSSASSILYRLSLAGSLAGLRGPSQRNLKLLPYVLGETLGNRN